MQRRADSWNAVVLAVGSATEPSSARFESIKTLHPIGHRLVRSSWTRRDFELVLPHHHDGLPIRFLFLAYDLEDTAHAPLPLARIADAGIFFLGSRTSAAHDVFTKSLAVRVGAPPSLVAYVEPDGDVATILREIVRKLIESLRSGASIDFLEIERETNALEAEAHRRSLLDEITPERIAALAPSDVTSFLLTVAYERAREALRRERVEIIDDYYDLLPAAWQHIVVASSVGNAVYRGGLEWAFGVLDRDEFHAAATEFTRIGTPTLGAILEKALALADEHHLWSDDCRSESVSRQLDDLQERFTAADDVDELLARAILQDPHRYELSAFGTEWT
jgi:uncharacterized protein (DUF1778 family)